MKQQVQRGEERMRESVEVLVTNRRQKAEKNPPVSAYVVLFAAINADDVAAIRQARRKLLGEGLKTAIARRNPSCSEDSDAHRPDVRYWRPWPRPLARRLPSSSEPACSPACS